MRPIGEGRTISVTIAMLPEMAVRLRQCAKAEGQSVSRLVRMMVEGWLGGAEPELPISERKGRKRVPVFEPAREPDQDPVPDEDAVDPKEVLEMERQSKGPLDYPRTPLPKPQEHAKGKKK